MCEKPRERLVRTLFAEPFTWSPGRQGMDASLVNHWDWFPLNDRKPIALATARVRLWAFFPPPLFGYSSRKKGRRQELGFEFYLQISCCFSTTISKHKHDDKQSVNNNLHVNYATDLVSLTTFIYIYITSKMWWQIQIHLHITSEIVATWTQNEKIIN